MTGTPKLNMILARIPSECGDGPFALWACRGEGKGCKRNLTRRSAKPCDDCYGPMPEQVTLGEVMDRINKGDA